MHFIVAMVFVFRLQSSWYFYWGIGWESRNKKSFDCISSILPWSYNVVRSKGQTNTEMAKYFVSFRRLDCLCKSTGFADFIGYSGILHDGCGAHKNEFNWTTTTHNLLCTGIIGMLPATKQSRSNFFRLWTHGRNVVCNVGQLGSDDNCYKTDSTSANSKYPRHFDGKFFVGRWSIYIG